MEVLLCFVILASIAVWNILTLTFFLLALGNTFEDFCIIYFMHMSVWPHVCKGITCLQCPQRALDPLGLELQMVMSCHVGAGLNLKSHLSRS